MPIRPTPLVSTLATVVSVGLLALGWGGCMASVSGEAYGPDLVYAAPGVQVIADYDDSIFYADSFYWRFSDGGWYRSPRYNGGWIIATPPMALRRIDRPHAFVHYRPAGWVSRRGREPPRREDRPRFAPPQRGEPERAAPIRQAPPLRGAPPRTVQPLPGGRDRPNDRDHHDERGHGNDRGHREDHR
jgi:hypothetical protein